MQNQECMILDFGSRETKVGWAQKESPIVFRTVVGRPRYAPIMVGMAIRMKYVGEEAQEKRGRLSLSYPIDRGIVTDWDDMELVFHHTFTNELVVASEDFPVILTDPPLNPRSQKEKFVELMFEKFCAPAMYLSTPDELVLCDSLVHTGVIVESGDGTTTIVPVFEGKCLSHAIVRCDLAGRDVTDNMMRLLKQKGFSLMSSAEREIACDIKEKTCYVALDYEKEFENYRCYCHYKLPDGQEIAIGSERFECAEVMFRPSLLKLNELGIHEMIYNSIMQCDPEIQQTLFEKIIMSGGNTMIPGMVKRIRKELATLVPRSTYIGITAPSTRRWSAWRGGAWVASDPNFNVWITSKDYDEHGPSIIFKKQTF